MYLFMSFVAHRFGLFGISTICSRILLKNIKQVGIRNSTRMSNQGHYSALKRNYRISANSFRGNYSLLNLALCTVTFVHSTYRCGNCSRKYGMLTLIIYSRFRIWPKETNTRRQIISRQIVSG